MLTDLYLEAVKKQPSRTLLWSMLQFWYWCCVARIRGLNRSVPTFPVKRGCSFSRIVVRHRVLDIKRMWRLGWRPYCITSYGISYIREDRNVVF